MGVPASAMKDANGAVCQGHITTSVVGRAEQDARCFDLIEPRRAASGLVAQEVRFQCAKRSAGETRFNAVDCESLQNRLGDLWLVGARGRAGPRPVGKASQERGPVPSAYGQAPGVERSEMHGARPQGGTWEPMDTGAARGAEGPLSRRS